MATRVAAIYARKSTDDSDRNEEARSTTRQVERAAEYAKAKGWTVDPRLTFVDDAASGAEWKHRPGFNALLAALEPRPAFSMLIVSELSRIGRDTVRTPAAILQLEEAGVEIRSYLSDAAITLADETGEMSTVLNSMLASFERRRARQRTYDALRRRAEAGAVTGGRVFGYLNERNGDGYVHRVIHEPEAAVVRRIFTLYAEGLGLTRIAKRLNAEGALSPRAGTGSWAGTAIREIIKRSIYMGVLTWNRTQKISRRGTRAQRHRPAEEWMERPAPELAIVDADLWQRVQARRQVAAETFLRSMKDGQIFGRPSGADRQSPYLLSGIASCSLCGGSLVAMTRPHGQRRVPFYGCLRYHKRGLHACANGLQIRQSALDQAVLDVLAGALDADVLAEAVTLAVAELTAGQREAEARRKGIRQELEAIATRERRLLDALVEGDETAGSIRERLRAELARRDALTAELTALETAPALDPDRLTQDLTARASDLRGLLGRHVTQARQVVRLLLEGRLVCQPFEENGDRGYSFVATGTYRKIGVEVPEPVNGGRSVLGPPAKHCQGVGGEKFGLLAHRKGPLRGISKGAVAFPGQSVGLSPFLQHPDPLLQVPQVVPLNLLGPSRHLSAQVPETLHSSRLDLDKKTATLATGETVAFEKALIATGGRPIRLKPPGTTSRACTICGPSTIPRPPWPSAWPRSSPPASTLRGDFGAGRP